MADADELFTLRNLFHLSNFQEAIAEAGTLQKLKTDALRLERDSFVYRSLIGLKEYGRVISAIREDAPLPLQAVKQLAIYMSAPEGAEGSAQRAGAVAKVDAMVASLAEADTSGAPLVQTVAGTLHIHEEQYEAALKAVRSGSTVELLSLTVQIFLRLERPDLADKQVKLMTEKEDESALTQLAAAAVCLARGGSKVKEAGLYYKDMLDRYGETVPVLNGAAVAALAARQYSDAATYLADALSRDPSNPDTLANMIAVVQHTQGGAKGAGETAAYLDRLKKAAPGHPYVTSYARAEAAFDRVAAGFS